MGTPAPVLRPVPATARIVSIDVLRGFALLGILVMNIQAYSMIAAAYFNPTAYGDLTGGNYRVWLLGHLLVDQKFMAIFSMLFGAGMLLMWQRAERSGGRPTRLHYRRMGWLILFGILHGYLLWWGDILYMYGMSGLLVYLFRRWRPRNLLIVGLIFLAVPSALTLVAGWTMPYWPEKQRVEMEHKEWRPTPEAITEENENYRGGWTDQMRSRAPKALAIQTFGFLFFGLGRAGGMMLIGMALFQFGVFSAARSARFYLAMIVSAVAVGLPVIAYGVRRNFEAGWDVSRFFFGAPYNYWGSVLVCLGWVGLVMLACRSDRMGMITRPLAAVGRMAFSNYILQTLICTTLFYGHGFGLFGQVSRLGQIGTVVAIWAIQIPLSVWWLGRYRFGPLEWLWRRLSYGKRQSFRLDPRESGGP